MKYYCCKLFFLAYCCLLNIEVNAQVNFKDRNLAMLETMAFNTTYKTVTVFLSEHNYNLVEETANKINLPNDKFLDGTILEFKGQQGNTLIIVYRKKDKAFLMVKDQIYAINTVFCEIELKNQSFKIISSDAEVKTWVKNFYRDKIITEVPKDKTHDLTFLDPNYAEF